MTGNQLVSRQAGNGITPAPDHPAQVGFMSRALSEIEARANMLASAGAEVLPPAYVNKPGACLMALDFADRYDLPIFEVLAEVSFNRGRPSVGARLQRKMAARRGVRTVRVEGDAESCTVAAVGPDGVELGRATYTYAQAQALGIIYGKDGRTVKPTWAGDPAQMLYHRATTRVLDHYGPSEFAGLFVSDQDGGAEPDVLDVLAPQPVAEAAPAADDDEVADAELVDDDLASTAGAAERLAHMVASAAVVDLKDATVLKEANRLAREASAPPVATLADLAEPGRAALYDAVLDWIGGH